MDKNARARELFVGGASIQSITRELELSRATFYRYREGWNLDVLTVGVLDSLRTSVTRYNTFPDRMEPGTFEIQVAKLLAQKLGVKIRFKPVAMAKLFTGIDAGEFDLAMGFVGNTHERRQRYVISEPYGNLVARPTGTLVAKRDLAISVNDLGSLAGLRIGAMGGSLSGDWLAPLARQNVMVKTFGNPSAVHYALLSHQIDAALEAYLFQAPFVAAHPAFEIKLPLIDYDACQIGLLLRPGDERMLNRVNDTILSLLKTHAIEPLEERLHLSQAANLPALHAHS
jgi:ABC-type amino acid transport substrate-binding protein